jgi:DNA-binding FadR family transcriptional regulator
MEPACSAAVHRTSEDIKILKQLLAEETKRDGKDPARLTEFDFSFHLHVAYACGNLIYSLILDSFK